MPRLVPGTRVEFLVETEDGRVEMGQVKGVGPGLAFKVAKAVGKALKRLEKPEEKPDGGDAGIPL